MAQISLTVTGLAELEKKFERLSPGAFNAALTEATEKSSKVAFNELRSNTPVDTGRLRDSITIENNGTKAFIGPGTELQPHYAADVEYGFHHWISGKFVQGQHYVAKTYITIFNPVKNIFKIAIRELLKTT